jgi:hypothetical protein
MNSSIVTLPPPRLRFLKSLFLFFKKGNVRHAAVENKNALACRAYNSPVMHWHATLRDTGTLFN